MSTRAIYSFIEGEQKNHVYKHHDGYPTGAAEWIAKALPIAWDPPRFEPDDFAAAFVAGNKDKGGGGIRLIAAEHKTPANEAARAFAADIEYRYEIRCVQGKLQVTAFSTSYWDGLEEEKLWEGEFGKMAKWAKDYESR